MKKILLHTPVNEWVAIFKVRTGIDLDPKDFIKVETLDEAEQLRREGKDVSRER